MIRIRIRIRIWVKRLLDHAVVGVLTLLVLFLLGVQGMRTSGALPVSALQSSQGGDAIGLGSVALDGFLGPVLHGRAFGRTDDVISSAHPIAASLWFAPFGSLFSGAGVGWCEFDKNDAPWPMSRGGHQEFRVHLSGGMMAPLTPSVGLDLRGSS